MKDNNSSHLTNDDYDDVERLGLLEMDMPSSNRRLQVTAPKKKKLFRTFLGICLAVSGVLLITKHNTNGQVRKPSTSLLSTSSDYPLNLECPQNNNLSTFNFVSEEAEEDYLDPKGQPDLGENFLETFRTHKFDGWGRTFEQFKESMLEFKTKHYVPYLKNGDRIYESACGLGLNLYLTLEILQEQGNISDITVYGNEYLEENTKRANSIIETLVNAQENVHTKNHLGSICHGDSTNLSFVPANSFDLVFTGYLSPLWDPLEFGLASTDDNIGLIYKICDDAAVKSNERQWEAAKLIEIMQERQEDWFSNWFQQMVRIAKPGAPVIVEEIALPLCDRKHDWGGVSRDFWKSGVERYGWDVNQSTLEFGSRSEEYDNKRYHVFFRKNEQQQ